MYKMGDFSIISEFSWVGDWAGIRAKLTPKKEAIYDYIANKRYTFDDLNTRANKLARVLLNNDIRKGDRVAVFSSNRIECIDLFLATGKIGAILVPFNVRLSTLETTKLLEKIEPKAFFYELKFSSNVKEFRNNKILNVQIGTNNKNEFGDPNYDDFLNKVPGADVERSNINLEDPHLILFTGGTTGLPKGAVLPHRSIYWNSFNTIISWGLTPEDIQPLLFPLFHTGGWNVLLVPFYHIGAKSILMGDFNPDDVLKVIEREKCTIVIGVPTMFHMMANSKNFESTDLSSVKIFISGGAPCPVALMEKYWARNKLFKMGYGLTEVGPNNFYLQEDYIKKKPESVGKPVFHCETKIVNTKTNEEIKRGEIGELLLRGPHAFTGYWQEPEETKNTIDSDGWVHTGDLVRQDEEGFFYIAGRKKEMYISGGENIFPVEIEEILYKHPAIDLVAVIGVPDEKWGEVGKAFIKFKQGRSATIEEIKEFLKDKLARYKIPKYFEIRDSLPISGSGKILKKDLK
ncbi:MAG: AMP-binding protein [Promethearchaeota archaeon]